MGRRGGRTTLQGGSAAVKTATLPSSATPCLVVCHIMLSINMKCAETTVEYGMWSNKGGYVRRTKLFAGRVIVGGID